MRSHQLLLDPCSKLCNIYTTCRAWVMSQMFSCPATFESASFLASPTFPASLNLALLMTHHDCRRSRTCSHSQSAFPSTDGKADLLCETVCGTACGLYHFDCKHTCCATSVLRLCSGALRACANSRLRPDKRPPALQRTHIASWLVSRLLKGRSLISSGCNRASALAINQLSLPGSKVLHKQHGDRNICPAKLPLRD